MFQSIIELYIIESFASLVIWHMSSTLTDYKLTKIINYFAKSKQQQGKKSRDVMI